MGGCVTSGEKRIVIGQGSSVIAVSDQFPDDAPVDVGQAAVDAVREEGEPLVVDPKLAENGRMDVINLGRMLPVERLVAPFIGWSVAEAPPDAAASW
jgi:hypothetical protein